MEGFIGLDVSMNETAISIRSDGKGIWRGKRQWLDRMLLTRRLRISEAIIRPTL